MKLETMEIPPGSSVMDDGRPFFIEGRGKLGYLLLHGFTGTTSSMKPMGEYLADKGVTVLAPRLPGHGTDVKDMGRWSVSDWTGVVTAAFEELENLCDKIFVAGLSMGGTLALYLGEKFPDRISGLVPICAPVFLKNPALRLVPFLKHLAKTLPGPGGDIKNPDVTEVAYDRLSVPALGEMLKLLRAVERDLGKITEPVRIIQARDDHVVPPENGPYIFDRVTSEDKVLVWLDNSYHVATLDYDRERVFEESYDLARNAH